MYTSKHSYLYMTMDIITKIIFLLSLMFRKIAISVIKIIYLPAPQACRAQTDKYVSVVLKTHTILTSQGAFGRDMKTQIEICFTFEP